MTRFQRPELDLFILFFRAPSPDSDLQPIRGRAGKVRTFPRDYFRVEVLAVGQIGNGKMGRINVSNRPAGLPLSRVDEHASPEECELEAPASTFT